MAVERIESTLQGMGTTVLSPMQGPSASSPASPVRWTVGRRVWVGVSSAGAVVLGVAPHVLHHVGLFAGALFAGVGGSLVFGAAGFLAAIPFLLRVHRRTGSGRVPVALLTLSPKDKKAMDQRIRSMRGASGEAQAHVFMGQRFTGCATGAAPAAFGSMMGMMGSYSGTSGRGMGDGRDGVNGFDPGMMGGSGSRATGNDGWSATNTVLVILLAVLLVAFAVFAAWGPWRRSSPKTPFDVLSERYARGDIDTADYEQRRHALGSAT